MSRPVNSNKSSGGKFRFIRHDHIGVPEAKEDVQFLHNCFVDTGDLEVLRDMSDHKRIVLGRTGSGKTALLMRLSQEESRVIPIKPESLALSTISNSKVLNFALQLGINLDVFFKLLWRHVFTVEVLRAHFDIKSEREKVSLLEKIKNFLQEEGRDDAEMRRWLEFLENWGRSYWKETESRVREIASNFENELQATLGSALDPFYINAENVDFLSAEQKSESAARVQRVLNQVHQKELSEVISKLGKVLDKAKVNYYITIDRLDENWIDEKLRYLLIRALIDTIREFHKAGHVKIVAALRYDLLARVIRQTRDASGFQEEKYEALYLHLQWTRERLIEVLDKRIDYLVKKRNPRRVVTHEDVLPPSIGRQPTLDYIVDRTLMRPRDIIHFFNYCIAQAAGKSKITVEMIRQAEGEYSRTRLRYLFDEWKANYPNLEKLVVLLKKQKQVFTLDNLLSEDCENFCLSLGVADDCENDMIKDVARKTAESVISLGGFCKAVAQIFYEVGLVGLKLETYEGVSWSFDGRRNISEAELSNETRVYVHPCFWRTLGIQERTTD